MLYKREDGKIRDDTFSGSIPLDWIITPSGYYSISERPGYLRMKHHATKDALAVFPVPPSFALEIEAEYFPTQAADTGGLILYRDSEQSAEFLEVYTDDTSSDVTRWRAIGQNNVFDLYSDSGEGIEFVDSVSIAPVKAGIVLKKGQAAGFVPLDVKRVVVTTSDTLIVGNLPDGAVAQLLSTDGQVQATSIASGGVAAIKMPLLRFDGRLVVKQGSSVLGDITNVFYGGDRYDKGSSVSIVTDPNTKAELSVTSPTDLGLMVNGVLLKQLWVYNPEPFAVTTVSIDVVQWNSKFGYQWADIANDVNGSPGTFSDSINISLISPGATVPFYVRITQGTDYDGLEPLYFGFDLKHM
ncbi:hypothetical protein GFC29_3814 (plasmid) [Anoxybacillus sp. B7M1]|uniref:hypothetical protein n=1 Tax=Anoxybacillus sp. B7M1 TaxID=1490057 RepID=UPI0005CD76E8|nr:hypothetical protein [Anoxybacillus sp. B7M1]ANB66148.1 hypothetical protein GFC29_3814 [Anoxybacillus sp. B7M1]